MLKEFWENKKHLIQMVGIMAGVGALFLSITPSENLKANEALANIQFVWLIIITISVILLFGSFIKLVDKWEKQVSKTDGLNLMDTFSILLSLTLLYLLINLWRYVINLYEESFWNFLQNTETGWFAIIMAVYYYFWRKLVLKISDKPIWKRTLFSLSCHAGFSLFYGLIITLLFSGGSLSFKKGLTFSIVFFGFLLLIIVYEFLRKKPTPKN